jgi:hypothetical protein
VTILVGLAILALLSVPFFIALSRANELACLEVVRGRVELRRGRIPQRLLGDIADVLGRPRVGRAVVRIVTEGGRPRVVVASGEIRGAQLQQLRNVVGSYQVAQIRAGGKRKR